MQYIDTFLACYGWEGAALAAVLLVLLAVQLYYYIFAYGRIPSYKNNRRPSRLEAEPPLSVVIPLFSEDYAFVEERLPLILAQSYPDFEVVLVYVGQDTDFFDDLTQLRNTFAQVTATRIRLDPRFPISRKMALNVGIKSAHYEHLVFTTPACAPQSDRWLSLMGKGFMKGEIVVGYCGMEPGHGLVGYLIRTSRMMLSVDWLACAVNHHAYRGILQNLGFTKRLYFEANGFTHLNMNIGEDDLFLHKIISDDNVSVILSPRAALREKRWGGLRWWTNQLRYFGAAFPLYPQPVKNFVEWEMGSHLLFFASAVCALAVMPLEYKLAVLGVLLIRYAVVAIQIRRIAKRLGEKGIAGRYFLYDLLNPFYAVVLRLLLVRKDDRVWR